MGGNKSVDVFLGSFLMGREKHKQNPQKIPGQSHEISVHAFCLRLFFSLPCFLGEFLFEMLAATRTVFQLGEFKKALQEGSL